MPIRFRCAFCNQLMGIARRKAGTVVRCPKCQGQVIVPNPETPAPPDGAPSPFGAAPIKGPVLFEQSDFEDNLLVPSPIIQPQDGAPSSLPPLTSAKLVTSVDVEPIANPEILGPGIFLSPNKLTVISVAIVVLLGLAFFMGLLVGRS